LTAGAPVDKRQIPSLKRDLSLLTRLARKLRKDREEIGGAVDLSSGDLGSELKFVLDENGNPAKVFSKKELEIHHTIAELMILANAHVAGKIFDSFPESALLRVHAAVEENRFEDLEEALVAGGISFNGSSNMALAQSLKQAEHPGKSGTVVNSLFRSLATRYYSRFSRCASNCCFAHQSLFCSSSPFLKSHVRSTLCMYWNATRAFPLWTWHREVHVSDGITPYYTSTADHQRPRFACRC
jgi:exoribonuclease R